ncbi:3'(2'),5'-bisphosphate nucleotidase CysQ [Allosphingosinicella sp.]|jgi:3'(2'), 5'-bisphosphate nucleotidase|uniref:3'(2'),5'-bisphosphate nucleotidase CysQ n=1 Tax=Allosphingosinicella sp. TaxID=2823234 RepID=UPI002EE2B511
MASARSIDGSPPTGDAELAARIADSAGRLLVQLRSDGLLDGPAAGRAGDLLANGLIIAALKQWRPDDAILSEESPDWPDRLGKSRVWIVDPLDGTREYSEGRDDWAVHIALAIDGAASVGAVAVPARGLLYRSDEAELPEPAPGRRPIMLVSRTRAPDQAAELAAAVGAEIVAMGSAGAKAMALVAGEADIYFHAGGQHEWDNCAPAAVAAAAGLHVTRCDGSPLLYNQERPYIPDLLICRSELAAPLLSALADLA